MDQIGTTNECGCSEFTLSRRSLLGAGAALGGTFAVSQLFGDALLQASFAANSGGNTLVVLSLRGGIDGLGVVVPHGDPAYYQARPSTAVPAASLICKDVMFGLHPGLAPLRSYWQAGKVAAIQATGLPIANRSHFSAIEEVEDAAPGSSARSGWINRMVGMGNGANVLEAVQLGAAAPTAALTGPAPTASTTDVARLQVPGLGGWSTQRYASLQTAWNGAQGPLATGFANAFSVSKGPGQQLASSSATTASYPSSSNSAPFVDSLRNAARLIKADVGTEVVAIDAGAWDFHTNYGNLNAGSMQSTVSGLGDALGAFLQDLGPSLDRTTIVTISEFGRRVAENGSQGFDHGWGNMMLVMGAGVRGGQYYGTWPGLDASQRSDGDLKVTTDYRNVLGEIISRRFPSQSVSGIFPGFSYQGLGFMS